MNKAAVITKVTSLQGDALSDEAIPSTSRRLLTAQARSAGVGQEPSQHLHLHDLLSKSCRCDGVYFSYFFAGNQRFASRLFLKNTNPIAAIPTR
jgi:hypothetical protein